MTMEVYQLDKFQDALNEVGNIGSGKAAGELSRVLMKEITQEASGVYLTPISSIPHLIGGQKRLVVGAYSSVSGDLTGSVLTVFPTKSALELVDLLSKKKTGSTKQLGKSEQAKVLKIGKLTSKSYTSTVSEFLELKIKQGEDRIIATFGESLVDFLLMGIKEDYALVLKTEFGVRGTDIQGEFILLLALDSLTKILEALRKKLS